MSDQIEKQMKKIFMKTPKGDLAERLIIASKTIANLEEQIEYARRFEEKEAKDHEATRKELEETKEFTIKAFAAIEKEFEIEQEKLEKLQDAIANYFYDEKDGTYSATASRIGVEMHNGQDVIIVEAIRASKERSK